MRTTYLISGLLLAACLLSGCINSNESSPAVAVVDSSRVFKESEPGKAGIKHLESLHESMQAELNALQQELQAKPDNEALQQKLQEKYMAYQQRIGAEQQQVINVLNDTIQKALNTCREQKKLALILGTDAVLSFGPAVDITSLVIAEVNKNSVTFKPVEPEPEVSAPVETPPANAQETAPTRNATETKNVPAEDAAKPANKK